MYKVTSPLNANLNAWGLADVMIPAHMVMLTSLSSVKKIENFRQERKKAGKCVPSYTAIILKAVALIIEKYPEINRAIIGPPFFKRIVQFYNYDINIAVEKNIPNTPGQAYSPTIKNVNKKNIDELTKELRFYSSCEEKDDKNLKLFLSLLKYCPYPLGKWILNLPMYFPSLWLKYKGCACWVNSPTKSGIDQVITTWPWPVTFSFGVVKKRPIVVNDSLIIEETMPLIMAFDRRLMGGGPAGRIFVEFKHLLEEADPMIFE